MLIGRNVNRLLNPCVDMSSPRSASSTKIKKMHAFLSDLDLLDVWRVLHPLDKDYTFFSNPHQVFSRIDYFLSSRTVSDRIAECTIGIQSIYDHSPVVVTSPPHIGIPLIDTGD